MFLAHILETEVVNNEAEHEWPPLVSPKYENVWRRSVVVFSKAIAEKSFVSLPDWVKPYTPFQILK